MPRTLNAVRSYKTQVGATVQLLAYVLRPDGDSIHDDDDDTIESATLTQEFGSRAIYDLHREAGVSIHAPSPPDELWIESIDGSDGYNFSYELDTAAPLLHAPDDSESLADPLTQGWYRLVVTFSSGAVQEFTLSLRD